MDYAFKSPWERIVSHRRSRSDSSGVIPTPSWAADSDDVAATPDAINNRARAQSWMPPRKKHTMSQVVFHPSDHADQQLSSSPMAPPPLDVPRTSSSSLASGESARFRDSASSTSTKNTSVYGGGAVADGPDFRFPGNPPKRPPRPERGLFDDEPEIARSRLNAWNISAHPEQNTQPEKTNDGIHDLIEETYLAFDASGPAPSYRPSSHVKPTKNTKTLSRESSLSRRTQSKSYFDTGDKPVRRKSSRSRPTKKFGRRSVQLPVRMMPKAIRWSLLADLLGTKRSSAESMLDSNYIDGLKAKQESRPTSLLANSSHNQSHEDDSLWQDFNTKCNINQNTDNFTHSDDSRSLSPEGRDTPTPPPPPKNPARFGPRGHVSHLPTIPESLMTTLENDLRRRRSIRSSNRLSHRSSITEQRISHYLNTAQFGPSSPPSRPASIYSHHRSNSAEDDASEWSDYNTPSITNPETPNLPGLPAPEEYEEEMADDMTEWFNTFGFESHGRLVASANPTGRGPTRSLNSVHSMDSSTSTLEDPDSPMPNNAEIAHTQAQLQSQMETNPASARFHLARLARLDIPNAPRYELPMDPEVKAPSPAPRMSCNLTDGLDNYLAWNPTPVLDETFYEE